MYSGLWLLFEICIKFKEKFIKRIKINKLKYESKLFWEFEVKVKVENFYLVKE